MNIGIGIDTGGTYTDAVAYDFIEKRILASAKALTTKEDLSIGIGNALDALPQSFLASAGLLSLSTTLATNACVENKGGHARMVFIGADRHVIDKVGKKYGLPDTEDISFADCECLHTGEILRIPDWDLFMEESRSWVSSNDAAALVSIHAMKNGAVLERKARDLLNEKYSMPVVCGHELFSDLNMVQRGSGTLLNARLIPVIKEFLAAVRKALQHRNLNMPVVIVRSDGTLMSEEFTSVRPVETLLCGPAASVHGGLGLSEEKDCLIIDMGGTTTDISIVTDGMPLNAGEGINIGKWKTFVKGVYIDTFGLGGDSAVTYDKHGKLGLEAFRMVPISLLSSQYPAVNRQLDLLLSETEKHSLPLHEFLVGVKDISDSSRYTEREKALCRELKKGPLILHKAAEVLQTDVYNMNMSRLEHDGIILRSGLTPTDIMHLKGDFKRFDSVAAEKAATFVSSSCGMKYEALCDEVYDMVKKKLYLNIVRLLLEHKYPEFRKTSIGRDVEKLILHSWYDAKKGCKAVPVMLSFSSFPSLVGIGAPTHIFLPDVAKALGTRCVIPEYAGVANAFGSITGNISAECEINVRPVYTVAGITGYTVFGKENNLQFEGLEEALKAAEEISAKEAREEAVRRGARSSLSLNTRVIEDASESKDGTPVYLGTSVITRAIGRVSGF